MIMWAERTRHLMDRVVTRVNTLLDPPLAHDARPLEVQGAIVDAIERRAEPVGGGRRVLPYRRLDVTVLARDEADRAALRAALDPLRDAVCTRLRELRCEWSSGLQVEVAFVDALPTGWTADQRFAVAYHGDGTPVIPTAPNQPPPLHLTVVRGRAAETSYTLVERRVGIGRSAAPIDSAGRVRVNHIAFLEDDADAHNQTVGRAHASIRYDAALGAYQLFDDGSRNGTRVVRGGDTFELVPGDPVGLTIQSGDQLQFGTTAVRVEIERATVT
jgi:hypothetical protein